MQELLAGCEAELLAGLFAGSADNGTSADGQAACPTKRLQEAAARIEAAIDPDCPNVVRDGGVIAKGFDAELDRLRSIGADGESWLAQYQTEQVRRSGVANLKVGYNQVFGYYIEITNAHADKVPADYVPQADAQKRRAVHHR